MSEATASSRLSRSAEFNRVYRHGSSVQNRFVVVYALESPASNSATGPRIGITVSRKVGTAVVRNRLKRQLRDALDQVTTPLDGFDVVVVARETLPGAIEHNDFNWLITMMQEAFTDLVAKVTKSAARS